MGDSLAAVRSDHFKWKLYCLEKLLNPLLQSYLQITFVQKWRRCISNWLVLLTPAMNFFILNSNLNNICRHFFFSCTYTKTFWVWVSLAKTLKHLVFSTFSWWEMALYSMIRLLNFWLTVNQQDSSGQQRLTSSSTKHNCLSSLLFWTFCKEKKCSRTSNKLIVVIIEFVYVMCSVFQHCIVFLFPQHIRLRKFAYITVPSISETLNITCCRPG